MGRAVPHTETPKASDQLPEEGPAEQVADDVPDKPEGAARETARPHIEEARRTLSEQRGSSAPDAGADDRPGGPGRTRSEPGAEPSG